MNTELKNAITATDAEAQYDESAKRLLGQKIILAHILVKAVDEFKGMNPKDVVSYIEGEPYISKIPPEPGLTNSSSEKGKHRIVGFNAENTEINEGLIRFDIVFYVRMKNGLSQIIVNIEAQKSEPTKYRILNRALFYVSRLISSQKERDFSHSDYNDMKRVYSIWICMNMPENIMTHIHLTKEDLINSYDWKGDLDLLNIIMIGLAKELPMHNELYELHRLLGALLSEELNVKEKLNIIETEYKIPVEEDFREEVYDMCNLSQGIKEKGIAIGEARGRAIGEARGRENGIAIGEARGRENGIAIGETKKEANIILNMYKKGFSMEQIAIATDKEINDIKIILQEKELIPM